jgi:Domain of unknown function (DUF5655)
MNKSHYVSTVENHFSSKDPIVREIYDQVVKAIRRIGSVIEEPKKTSIHLVNSSALAGVATRKDSLILTLKSDRKLTSPRIHKSEQVSAGRFHHEVKLRSQADVDNELIGWLREAYKLSSNQRSG